MNAQNKISNYEYAVVSDKFDFLRKPDMYKTSSLTKFLLNKKGFKAYLSSDDLPKEILNNRCRVIFVKVLNSSGAFSTKNAIEFRDCNNKVVYTTKIGKSRKKDFQPAYHEAIRNAFSDMEIVNYSYQKPFSKPKNVKERVANKQVVETTNELVVSSKKEAILMLNATATENGFQLKDTLATVKFELLKTSSSNLFIVKHLNGVLQLKNNNWVLSFYENGQLIEQTIFIKF